MCPRGRFIWQVRAMAIQHHLELKKLRLLPKKKTSFQGRPTPESTPTSTPPAQTFTMGVLLGMSRKASLLKKLTSELSLPQKEPILKDLIDRIVSNIGVAAADKKGKSLEGSTMMDKAMRILTEAQTCFNSPDEKEAFYQILSNKLSTYCQPDTQHHQDGHTWQQPDTRTVQLTTEILSHFNQTQKITTRLGTQEGLFKKGTLVEGKIIEQRGDMTYTTYIKNGRSSLEIHDKKGDLVAKGQFKTSPVVGQLIYTNGKVETGVFGDFTLLFGTKQPASPKMMRHMFGEESSPLPENQLTTIGTFKDEKLTGRGLVTTTDGTLVTRPDPMSVKKKNIFFKLDGTLVSGSRFGNGVLRLKNGDIYDGALVRGKRTGYGVLTKASGDVYKGNFVNGVLTVFGELEKKDTKAAYTGMFVDGQPEGQGSWTYYDGSKYEGSTLNGKYNGEGSFTDKTGIRSQGTYVNDKLVGYGIRHHADGALYEGEFIDGKKSNGRIQYSNGDVYEGEFLYEKGSTGRLQHSNGNAYEGKFIDGKIDLTACSSQDNLNRLGEAIVLPYGFKGHAMMIRLERKTEGLDLQIYNSGLGLEKFHPIHPENPNKFQTCLPKTLIGVERGTRAWNELLNKLVNFEQLDCVEEAYDFFQPGHYCGDTKFPFQTAQKGGNCTFESVMAFLRNNMPTEGYKKYRLELITDVIQKLTDPENTIPEKTKAPILERLNTMYQNRTGNKSSADLQNQN